MRNISLVGVSFLCFLFLFGCDSEEAKQKAIAVTIQVLDEQRKPVPHVATSIEAVQKVRIINGKQVGFIPIAVLTDQNGKVQINLTAGENYVIQVGSVKKEITVTDQPMTVEIQVNRKKER